MRKETGLADMNPGPGGAEEAESVQPVAPGSTPSPRQPIDAKSVISESSLSTRNTTFLSKGVIRNDFLRLDTGGSGASTRCLWRSLVLYTLWLLRSFQIWIQQFNVEFIELSTSTVLGLGHRDISCSLSPLEMCVQII